MLGHVNTELQTRFARSCTDAAFGYARAASAAYAAFADQTLDFWSQAAQRSSGRDSTPAADYFVTGPRRSTAASLPTPFDFFRMPDPWQNSTRAAFAPVAAWWGLAPFDSNPASWPMAYSMMAAGVPRAVAVPAAEANVAAMDAADAATQTMNHAFSSYRSESGFAMSQVIAPKSLANLFLLAPLGAAALTLPWWIGSQGAPGL